MGPFERWVNLLSEDIRVGQVTVPRYEVDVLVDSREEAQEVIAAVRGAPRVGRVFSSLGLVTVEVNMREARTEQQARDFVAKLLTRAGLSPEMVRAA